jgi:hypothetical protein
MESVGVCCNSPEASVASLTLGLNQPLLSVENDEQNLHARAEYLAWLRGRCNATRYNVLDAGHVQSR